MKLIPESKKSTMLAQKQLEIGLNVDQSTISAFKTQLEKHGYLTWNQLESLYKLIQTKLKQKKLKQAKELLESFMLESLLLDKQPTLNDNENYFLLLSQILKLYQILDPDLTFTSLGLPPWFERFAETKSLKLLLPTKTDCVELDTNYLNLSVKNMAAVSWFTVKALKIKQNRPIQNMNLKRIYSPLLMSSSLVTTVNDQQILEKNVKESQKKLTPTGILKIRLYPTLKQQKKLNKLFDANRYAWNILNEKSKGELFKLTKQEFDKKFRPFVKKCNLDQTLSIYECNEQCFDSAYRDFVKAIKTTRALSATKKLKFGKGFSYPEQLKFKTKKEGGNSIEIRGRDITYNGKNKTLTFFKKYFNNTSIKMKTDLEKLKFTDFEFSCRLNMIGDEFYLNVPYVRKIETTKTNKFCAIDPGVRTFLTGYDQDGFIFEIANKKDLERIYKKKHRISKLQSLLQKETSKCKKDKLKDEIRNLYKKIKNSINDLHHKASKILADSYDEIILPIFKSQEMVKNNDATKVRRITSNTAGNLLTLSHFKFRTLLDHKMKLRGKKLHVCTEEYTSKTCGSCGRLNHQLGSKEIFKCNFESCKMEAGRDANAARNILIKNNKLITNELIMLI